MQDREFIFDLRLLHVGAYDVVFEIGWIDSISPIALHTKPLGVSLIKESQIIHLLSDTSSESLSMMQTTDVIKLLNKGQCNYVT